MKKKCLDQSRVLKDNYSKKIIFIIYKFKIFIKKVKK